MSTILPLNTVELKAFSETGAKLDEYVKQIRNLLLLVQNLVRYRGQQQVCMMMCSTDIPCITNFTRLSGKPISTL